MARRKLEDLNVLDDFLFQEMITRGEKGERFCQILLSIILGKKIGAVRIVPQKVITGGNTDKRGIRMDAYIEEVPEEIQADVDRLPDIYDIEPNKYKTTSEARRARYYHALIDTKLLKTGEDYHKLRNVIMIMILPYDPFGKNRMIYTIKNRCTEDETVIYEDGIQTIYLYTKGTEGVSSQELKGMLKYIEESTEENAKGSELQDIHKLVKEIKKDEEVGIQYMKTWEWEAVLKEEGRIDGRNEGRIEGEERLSKLVKKLIEKSLNKQLEKALNDKEYREKLYKEFNI